MNFKFNLKKLLALAGAGLVLVTSMTGCSKKADCGITGSHAHLYKNSSGYVRYIDEEYLKYEGYERTDESISIEGQEKLYKFLDKKNLMRIDDNIEKIKSIQDKQTDYTEYRYKYTYRHSIPHYSRIGKVTTITYTYVTRTAHSWTKDPNHSGLTGETRICHHAYVAYKVEKDEKGKYVLIPSKHVDDLTEIMDEYPYIKKSFVVILTKDGKVADYEDGKIEDLPPGDEVIEENEFKKFEQSNVSPQSYSQEQGKTLTKKLG